MLKNFLGIAGAFTLVVFSLLLPFTAQASIGIAYIKNNHTTSVSIWINGYFQGYVPAGKTCYTVVEGFVTTDSGFQADGSLVQNYSHAGWQSGSQFVLTAMAYVSEKDKFYWQGSFIDRGEGSSGWGGTGESRFYIGGEPPITDLDVEFSTQILKGGSGKLTLENTRGLGIAPLEVPAKPGGYFVGGNSGSMPVLQAMGTGEIQIALTWSGAPDVDLYVYDPSGGVLSYNNKEVPSGGFLDRDDTDGFGPENVAWPRGSAPPGTYRVAVTLYAGESANFTVHVLANGKTTQYTGTLYGEKTTREVCTFTLGNSSTQPTNK